MVWFLYYGNYPTGPRPTWRGARIKTPLGTLPFMDIYLNIKIEGIAFVYLKNIFAVVLHYVPYSFLECRFIKY